MTDQLKVYHLKAAGDKGLPLPKAFWHLATCLRSIVITESEETPKSLCDHDRMDGERAYEFLLGIICGLDSPLLGETEVFGQFKEFLRNHDFSTGLQEVFNSLLRDAKKIRADYLQNLGCTSYGSLLRKELRGGSAPLTILGAGSLAQDIFPWFAKSGTAVNVYTRSPQKYQNLLSEQENLQLLSYEQLQQNSQQGVLVIAAPLSAQWIQEQVDLKEFHVVYDLRGESQTDPLRHSNVTSLKSLFDSIEMNKRQAMRTKEKAMSAIKKKANHFILVEKPRPFGWDDLWACS